MERYARAGPSAVKPKNPRVPAPKLAQPIDENGQNQSSPKQDDSSILFVGQKTRRFPDKYDGEIVCKPSQTQVHWYTGGHGIQCGCNLCQELFHKTPRDNSKADPWKPHQARLVTEYLLSPRRGNPMKIISEPCRPVTAANKIMFSERMIQALVAMDDLLMTTDLRHHAAPKTRVAVTPGFYPDIQSIIIDEERIFYTNNMGEYSLNLSTFSTNQPESDLETMIPNSLVIATAGLNYGNSQDVRIKMLSKTVNSIADYNRAVFRSKPLSIYVIGGTCTILHYQDGTLAGHVLCKWIDEDLDDGETHITWLGTGKGKPMSLRHDYRDFAKVVTTQLTEKNLRSYDLFHGRQGDKEGNLLSGRKRDGYSTQLRAYIQTGESRLLPPWSMPRTQDGQLNYVLPTYVKRHVQAYERDLAGLMPVPRHDNLVPKTEEPRCAHCCAIGHSMHTCTVMDEMKSKKKNERKASNRRTNHYQGRLYQPQVSPSHRNLDDALAPLFRNWIGEVKRSNRQ